MPASVYQQRQYRKGLADRGSSSTQRMSSFLFLAMAATILCGLAFISSTLQGAYDQLDLSYLRASTTHGFEFLTNAKKMKIWKTETESACRAMIDAADGKDTKEARLQKEEIEKQSIEKFTFPGLSSSDPPTNHQPYQFCRNVFIDLGTNIGDSIGYFIDNALDVCTPLWLEQYPKTRLNQDFPRPHLDVTNLGIIHRGMGNNPLYGMLRQQMRQGSIPEASKSDEPNKNTEDSHTTKPVTPESFCVYGMEGNPEFTHRLQSLENYIMQTEPRPIQHLHIHTESVVTAQDGPTKLYLDKTSVKENRMVLFGGRGWSIFELSDDPSELLKLVFDSADDAERVSCERYPWAYNAKYDNDMAPGAGMPNNTYWLLADEDDRESINEANDPEEDGCEDQGDGTPGACPMGETVDSESDGAGPAFENIDVGIACGRLVTVVCSEGNSMAWLYDITNIVDPTLVQVFPLSPASEFKSPGLAYNDGTIGEIDPEAFFILSDEESPTGKAGLFVGGAYSSTVSFWEFECESYEPLERTETAPLESGTTSSLAQWTTMLTLWLSSVVLVWRSS